MNLQRFECQNNHLRKILAESSLGEIILELIDHLPKKDQGWIKNFIEMHNFDALNKKNKEQIDFILFFSNILYQDDILLLNIVDNSETVVEVDFLAKKNTIVLRAKIVGKEANPLELESIDLSYSDYKDEINWEPNLTIQEACQELDNRFRRMAKLDIFSGTVLIAKSGKIIFSKAIGQASKRYKMLNTHQTKFNLGSMNKIFTAAAILQLYEQEKLKLSDCVQEYLPSFPNGDRITIHHLLTHTSGLGSFWNKRWEEKFRQIRSIDNYLDLFIDDELLFQPGERFEYSNAGFIVLGKVIEAISGKSYDEYIKEAVYTPAKMKNTGQYDIDREIPDLAMGYTHYDIFDQFHPEMKFNNFLKVPVKGSSAGGGYSTIEDLFNFSIALEEERLLKRETLNLMKNPSPDALANNYGYGCQVGTFGNLPFYGHGGGTEGVATMLMIFPTVKMVLAILSNYCPLYEISAEYQIEMIIKQLFPKA
ncbi:MAG: serine hydrolase domain-containing protein [Candidatus Hodarchaeota archaeon]